MVALNTEASKTNSASDQSGISRYFHDEYRGLDVYRKCGVGSVGIGTHKFDIEPIDKGQITTESIEI